jgi:hypothetical protein
MAFFLEYTGIYDISTLLLMITPKDAGLFSPGILLKNDFVLRAKVL